jgi:hypothetical protein
MFNGNLYLDGCSSKVQLNKHLGVFAARKLNITSAYVTEFD